MSPRAPIAYVCLLVFVCALVASACGGGNASAQGGGPGAMPPAEVQAVTLAPRPVPRTSEFIGHHAIALVHHRPTAGRGHRPPASS